MRADTWQTRPLLGICSDGLQPDCVSAPVCGLRATRLLLILPRLLLYLLIGAPGDGLPDAPVAQAPVTERDMPIAILKDQIVVWTSPVRIRTHDLIWLLPLRAAAGVHCLFLLRSDCFDCGGWLIRDSSRSMQLFRGSGNNVSLRSAADEVEGIAGDRRQSGGRCGMENVDILGIHDLNCVDNLS